MSISKVKKEEIKEFLLSEIKDDRTPYNAVEKYEVSRQTIRKYLKELEDNKLIVSEGVRKKEYDLNYYIKEKQTFNDLQNYAEEKIYENFIVKHLKDKSNNFKNILSYAFTEMVNNAIDHSNGKNLIIEYKENYFKVLLIIYDDGVGIFNRIIKDHNLNNEDEAIFELSKGKLTSDKSKHSGEGIFFTSKIVDNFMIFSGKKMYKGNSDGEIKEIEGRLLEQEIKGTLILFSINKNTNINTREVFDKFALSGNFDTTQIIIKLATDDCNSLVSRSEAKRIMNRVNEFKKVILDFEGIQFVGQGFCDEVFRVFKLNNRDIEIEYINAEADVKYMIDRAILSYEQFIKE